MIIIIDEGQLCQRDERPVRPFKDGGKFNFKPSELENECHLKKGAIDICKYMNFFTPLRIVPPLLSKGDGLAAKIQHNRYTFF